MAITPEQDEFWDRVDHDMKMKNPGIWSATLLLLRGGMSLVLFGAAYMVFFYLLTPPKGYFISTAEMAIHPLFWVLAGAFLILGGAYLRFRAMSPIVDKFKTHGFD